jgi:N-acylneuraminate cytidylyltransferase
VAKYHGAEVLMRSKKLAGDNVPMLPVLQDVVSKIECDVAVLLQTTSPIRDAGLIDSCIKRFLKKKADNLATGFICKYQEYGTYNQNRQKLKGFFYDDGNVYVMKASLLKQGRMIGKKVEKVVIDREQNIEIDEPFDFWLAEQVLKKRTEEGK